MARAAPEVGGRASPRRLLEREGAFSWIMLAPGVLFLIAFVAYPFFYGIYLSLQERQVAKAGTLRGAGQLRDPLPRRCVLAGVHATPSSTRS